MNNLTVNNSKAQESDCLDAWLLTREWRDTRQGIELTFWASSKSGPIKIIITGTSAICFINRQKKTNKGITRKPVKLQSLQGNVVDALYFHQQAQLNTFVESQPPSPEIYESDIKPADRYLMERFITGGITITGQARTNTKGLEFINPKLQACDYRPQLKLLSFDIETNYQTSEILSIAGLFFYEQSHTEVVFIVSDEAIDTENKIECRCSADESALLRGFFSWLCEIDPDVLIGWNVINFDLQSLEERCEFLGLPFTIGRGGAKAKILKAVQRNQINLARIPGRVVLDGIDTLRAAFWSFESFALDYVAHMMLGKGKLISGDENRAEEILSLYRTDKTKFIAYNIEDCRLVREIFQHTDLLNFSLERASITGLAFGRNGGSIAAFDFLYLPKLHRSGFVAPDAQSDQADGLTSPGGYVMDSIPGFYSNVLVLDFKSLYPSIIRTFLIDPLGLHRDAENPVPGYDGAQFSRSQAILPQLISSLWQKRDQAKKNNNQAMSQAVKIIMNSFYGVLGASACRFCNSALTSSITKRGHDILQKTKNLIEAEGHKVIYGDTDSVFVWLEGEINQQQADKIGNGLAELLNQWWNEHVNHTYNLTCYLEIEFETHYLKFLMPTVRGSRAGSKKRYAGSIITADNESKLIFKGLETVRTDWTPLAREFQKKLFQLIFSSLPYEQFIRETVSRLQSGQLDKKLSYRKRIRQSLDAYQKNVPPHIQAARQLSSTGRWIEYFITVVGPQPRKKLSAPLDYAHYQEKQLKPVADTILQFVGSNFDDIVSGQMDIF